MAVRAVVHIASLKNPARRRPGPGDPSRIGLVVPFRLPFVMLALVLTLSLSASIRQRGAQHAQPARTDSPAARLPDSLSAAEFARLVQDISEDGGYFHSDNLISNETTYLHIVHKLQQLGATSGAYIGVGPEQNFTYIAKIRPRIAFIVDIRRQAMVQQLMYKAIFHLAPARADFLSLLLSKPLPKTNIPPRAAPASDLLSFFGHIATDDKAYEANLD